MSLNVVLLLLAAAATLTGFDGTKVEKLEDAPANRKSLFRRTRPLGWFYLLFVLLGLGLGIYKEQTSIEHNVRAVYPNFYDLVQESTGYDKDQWAELTSFRQSLRFILQRLHLRVKGNRIPESMAEGLRTLGAAGALPEDLCRRLDYIRFHTYTAEWGRVVTGPPPTALATLRKDALAALTELERIANSIDPQRLVARSSTNCGSNPAA